MRTPVDSRSIAWLIARSFLVRALAVKVAAVLVLITVILVFLWSGGNLKNCFVQVLPIFPCFNNRQ
jgi:hypothetical protein